MTSIEELSALLTKALARIAALERTSQLGHSSVADDDGNSYNARSAIVAGTQASIDAANALSALTDLQATTDGKMTIFYNPATDPPTEASDNPEYGDIWMRQGASGQYDMLQYDGDTWVLIQDQQQAAAALAAAQNAQDTADGKIESYWQASDPTQAVPAVVPSSGDLWYQTGTGPDGSTVVIGVYRWDVTVLPGSWQPLPLATGALALGAINPDRLTVGVTGNLIQDPDAKTALRTPPNAVWSIQPADLASSLPDSNYFRCQARGASSPPQTWPNTSTVDQTWRITDPIQVTAGQVARFAAYVRFDSAAAVGAAAARLRVYFYKPGAADTAYLSGSAQLAQLKLTDPDQAGAAGTYSLLTGNFQVPDGYTGMVCALQTSSQTTGSIDYAHPTVVMVSGRVQSPTFTPGDSGYLVDERTTQFENVHALNTVGGLVGNFERIQLGGQDLDTEYIATLPKGVVAYDAKAAGHTALTSGTTELKLYEFTMGVQLVSRLYKITAFGHLQGTVAGDAFDIKIRYTTDGTAPVATSTLLRVARVNIPTVTSTAFEMSRVFTNGSYDQPRLRFGVFIQRASGTGSAQMYGTQPERAFSIFVEDLGLYYNAAVVGTLSQKSYADGTAADPDPTTTYSTRYNCVWSRSYLGDGSIFPGDPSDLYQGYRADIGSDTRSLLGFQYTNIQADIPSAATVLKCTLTFRVKHGETMEVWTSWFGTHSYTTKPSTWSTANVVEAQYGYEVVEGSTYTMDLGTGIGNMLKSGSARGISLGPSLNGSTELEFGYLYGAGSVSPPYLTLTYSK